ncbi:MFS transporter [Coxiella burnetii]|uniref:MFS transporter n=1 Tax=Coxiella burnetii TaxID=777 RepID=UPI00217626B1|nr:MFS transporter [Coxiella burnetii]
MSFLSFKLVDPQISESQRYWYAAIALFIVPLSGLSIDIFVPSLPVISHYFGATKSLAQLSITMYMLGMGVMQLFSGSISDSFVRKKPFLIAMLINIVVTLLIPLSHTIYELLFLRLMQGILVAILIVPIRAIFDDLFSGVEFHKMTTYSTVIWSIGPVVAPAIGGYLQHYFGWQSNVYFIGVYNIIAFLLILFFMPETSRYRHPFQTASLLQRYKEILSHSEYIRMLIVNCALYSIVILFSIVGSFLIQKVLHYSPVDFGHMEFLTGLAWFFGAMTNRAFIHAPYNLKVKIGLWSLLIVSLISIFAASILPLTIYAVMIPTFILIYLGGTVFPNNFAKALSLFPKINGSANSLFGAFIFLLPGLSSALGTLLKTNSVIPLLTSYLGLIAFSLIIFYARLVGVTVRKRML